MKIIKKEIPIMTIEELANKYDLTMYIGEIPTEESSPNRYHASFERIEIKDGCFLESRWGNGSTPEEAIDNYTKEINLKPLVKNAYSGPKRIDIPPTRIKNSKEK